MADGNSGSGDVGLPRRVLGRVVGSVVNPIVDNVDVDQVVERIDVDQLLEGIDVDRVLDRIDPNRLLDRIDVQRLLDRVDPDALLDRIDPNRLLDRVDPDALLDRIDPNRLLDRVDPNRLLDRVDPNPLLDRVDPNTLVGRLDPNPLMEAVDVQRLLDRVDPNTLLDRIDVNALVERTELGAIIARSTTGVFTQLLDVVRTQIVLGDQIAQGIPARVLRGAARELPPVPGGPGAHAVTGPMSPGERAIAVQGRAAGSVSRYVAFLVDQFAIALLFTIVSSLVRAAVQVVTGSTIEVDEARLGLVIAYALWAFIYTAGSLTVSGRTIGKAMLGLLVVQSDGSRLNGRHASVRTIAFPLSFLLFGVGFLLGLVRRDRRQLHDLIAGTAVVYAWDARTAMLRAAALADTSSTVESAPSTPTVTTKVR